MATNAVKKQKRFPVFQNRFRELKGDLKQGEFAEKIGVSRATVGFYESGERLPDALILNQIADRCDVSVDWLLGRTNVMTVNEDIKILHKTTMLSEQAIENLVLRRRVDECDLFNDLLEYREYSDICQTYGEYCKAVVVSKSASTKASETDDYYNSGAENWNTPEWKNADEYINQHYEKVDIMDYYQYIAVKEFERFLENKRGDNNA